jgi:protein-disulfide isomerase
MRDKIERLLSSALTVSAVVLAFVAAHREFSGRDDESTARPTYVANWRELEKAGSQGGNPNGRVRVIEFSDLQCPYCKSFHGTLRRLVARNPRLVSHVVLHYPLEQHEHAMELAKAAECAADQGRLEPFLDAAFARQTQIAMLTNLVIARAAGVPDLRTFASCSSDTASIAARRVAEHIELGRTLPVMATPTVIVNGWRFVIPPNDSELSQAVTRILAGRSPFAEERTWFRRLLASGR